MDKEFVEILLELFVTEALPGSAGSKVLPHRGERGQHVVIERGSVLVLSDAQVKHAMVMDARVCVNHRNLVTGAEE